MLAMDKALQAKLEKLAEIESGRLSLAQQAVRIGRVAMLIAAISFVLSLVAFWKSDQVTQGVVLAAVGLGGYGFGRLDKWLFARLNTLRTNLHWTEWFRPQ